jgi:hypothetical protein
VLSAPATTLPVRIAQPLARPAFSSLEAAACPDGSTSSPRRPVEGACPGRVEGACPEANVPFEVEGACPDGSTSSPCRLVEGACPELVEGAAGGVTLRPYSLAPSSTNPNWSACAGSCARSSYRLRTFPRLASSRRHVRRLRCLCLRARRNQITAATATMAIDTIHGHPLQAELPRVCRTGAWSGAMSRVSGAPAATNLCARKRIIVHPFARTVRGAIDLVWTGPS